MVTVEATVLCHQPAFWMAAELEEDHVCWKMRHPYSLGLFVMVVPRAAVEEVRATLLRRQMVKPGQCRWPSPRPVSVGHIS